MTEVSLEITTGTAVLTLDAPARLNAITPDMADAIAAHCQSVTADPTIAALVVRGAGDSFCSGADLSSLGEVSADPLRDDNFEAIERIYRAFLAVEELDVLTIAAVKGAAVGAGLNLLLATDIRIVAHDARLLSGFVKLGLHPGGGHFDLLARSSSPQVACALGLAGQRIDGDDAVRLGLAWEAADAADVDARAIEIADGVAANPAVARAAKRSIRLSVTERATRQAAVQIERVQQLRTVRRVGSAVTRK
ncbi:MAG: enoyl-CoA hydratase-related protein [Mycobacterium sp.]